MRHSLLCGLRSLLVALIVLATPANARPSGYSITDLGTLGGATSKGYGINSRGEVTGEAMNSDGTVHAFLYANHVMRDLNSLIDPAEVTLISGRGSSPGAWRISWFDRASRRSNRCWLLSCPSLPCRLL
jgi:probable HAF family extracellular repeat protein